MSIKIQPVLLDFPSAINLYRTKYNIFSKDGNNIAYADKNKVIVKITNNKKITFNISYLLTSLLLDGYNLYIGTQQGLYYANIELNSPSLEIIHYDFVRYIGKLSNSVVSIGPLKTNIIVDQEIISEYDSRNFDYVVNNQNNLIYLYNQNIIITDASNNNIVDNYYAGFNNVKQMVLYSDTEFVIISNLNESAGIFLHNISTKDTLLIKNGTNTLLDIKQNSTDPIEDVEQVFLYMSIPSEIGPQPVSERIFNIENGQLISTYQEISSLTSDDGIGQYLPNQPNQEIFISVGKLTPSGEFGGQFITNTFPQEIEIDNDILTFTSILLESFLDDGNPLSQSNLVSSFTIDQLPDSDEFTNCIRIGISSENGWKWQGDRFINIYIFIEGQLTTLPFNTENGSIFRFSFLNANLDVSPLVIKLEEYTDQCPQGWPLSTILSQEITYSEGDTDIVNLQPILPQVIDELPFLSGYSYLVGWFAPSTGSWVNVPIGSLGCNEIDAYKDTLSPADALFLSQGDIDLVNQIYSAEYSTVCDWNDQPVSSMYTLALTYPSQGSIQTHGSVDFFTNIEGSINQITRQFIENISSEEGGRIDLYLSVFDRIGNAQVIVDNQFPQTISTDEGFLTFTSIEITSYIMASNSAPVQTRQITVAPNSNLSIYPSSQSIDNLIIFGATGLNGLSYFGQSLSSNREFFVYNTSSQLESFNSEGGDLFRVRLLGTNIPVSDLWFSIAQPI